MIVTRSGSIVTTSGGSIVAPRIETPVPDLAIVSHGDSNARDRGDANYIFGLKSLILSERSEVARVTQRGINGISYNYAWEGDVYDGTLIDHGLVIDAERVAGIPNWLILLAGINGMALGSHNVATEYADFRDYIDARITAGWVADRIVVCALTPRDGFPYGTISSYNSTLLADAGDRGYRVARLDLDPDFGGEGDDANLTWYYDGKHYTDATHAKIAQILFDTMFPA